ncbi:unnamed protein product, partial [Brenthis ino]
MSSKSKFECCHRLPSSTEVILCRSCKKRYHYNCVSTSKTSYAELTENYKSTWLCPICARPKSDNTNTPIRGSLSNSALEEYADQSCNVTRRIKDSERKIMGPTTAEIDLDDVRSIVREEMKSLLDVFKKSILDEFTSKTNEVLASINFLEDQYETIKKELSAKNDEIKLLQANNNNLKTTARQATGVQTFVLITQMNALTGLEPATTDTASRVTTN